MNATPKTDRKSRKPEREGKECSFVYGTRRDDSGTLVAAAGGCGDVQGEPLLLSLTGLVVLEPVKDVLPFDLAVLPEPG